MDTVLILAPVRRVGEFRAGEITVCKDPADGGLYTVLRVRDRQLKLLFIEAGAEMLENGGEYRFSVINPEGGVLTVAAPHVLQRKLIDFAALSYPTVQEKVGLCLELVRACMASGIPWWLLYLCLDRENVQLYPSGAIKFDLFIDLDSVTRQKSERDCARRCGALILEILGSLADNEKRRSNAYLMAQMMERNDSYSTLLQLHRDLDAVLKNPSRTPSLNKVWNRCKKHIPLIVNILRVTAAALALTIAVLLLKSFVFSDISLPDFHYGGLDKIGEINL